MEITICVGSSCHLKGSRDVIRILERLVAQNQLKDRVDLKGSFCMGECAQNGVCVSIDGDCFHISPPETESFFHGEVRRRLLTEAGE